MNICFETFGCRLNRAEALDTEAKALALGHRIVSSHAKADAIIVRGCSVTARAQADCNQLIGHLKRKYPNTRLIVTGCLPEAQKDAIRALYASRRTSAATSDSSSSKQENAIPTRTARAYLKVQDGCAGACTFCIVPKFRGASTSEDFQTLVDKAKRFVDAGYHEIVVTGCNLTLYANAEKRLPDLLGALAEIDAGCRIRLGSVEPWGCAGEVIDAMAAHDNVCRFLHMPVQSGSDRILKLMNRPYSVEDVVRLTEKARKLMPMLMVGCDVMAGFPGESEGDFLHSKTLLSRLAFANAHVFPYSERPGTAAEKLPGKIPRHVRSDRAHTLSDIAKANCARFARKFVNKTVDVVVESHGTQPKGWTSEYLWFEGPLQRIAPSKAKSARKQLMRFVVRSSDGGVLHGVPLLHGR